ncbi:MAG TPA: class I SAM-dependent methyltransferase [Terriglobia bacterium]|nr:class I SAM-dependent methyltransferase [Terriglobia bacterium]
MSSHASEIKHGQRFQFGKNWASFLRLLDEQRILNAQQSLSAMLEMETLEGKSFLDVGSGSGLSSLAAARMGAAKIHSFDFDPQCVGCTRELKRRYFPQFIDWTIEEGSALDVAYLAARGQFDIVYSWGVLQHTGQMWKALEAVIPSVVPGGRLFVAIFNDQGTISRFWKKVKSFYVRGWLTKTLVVSVFIPYFVLRGLAADLLKMKNPFTRYREYSKGRGMSVVRDWIDWLGGYPVEFAKPEEIFDFYRQRGFKLIKLRTCGGSLGNNEFVFVKGRDGQG